MEVHGITIQWENGHDYTVYVEECHGRNLGSLTFLISDSFLELIKVLLYNIQDANPEILSFALLWIDE